MRQFSMLPPCHSISTTANGEPATASAVITVPCYRSGWGFNAFKFDDFESNIDDPEDFNLGSIENSKRFGPPLSEKALALDQAISDRIPEKTRKTTQWAVSVFVHGVMLMASRMPQKVWQLKC